MPDHEFEELAATETPQGVLAAGSDDGTILFLDAATLEPLGLTAGHGTAVADGPVKPCKLVPDDDNAPPKEAYDDWD